MRGMNIEHIEARCFATPGCSSEGCDDLSDLRCVESVRHRVARRGRLGGGGHRFPGRLSIGGILVAEGLEAPQTGAGAMPWARSDRSVPPAPSPARG